MCKSCEQISRSIAQSPGFLSVLRTEKGNLKIRQDVAYSKEITQLIGNNFIHIQFKTGFAFIKDVYLPLNYVLVSH